MITQILPVAIRGIMEPWVPKTVLDLCNFFDTTSQKSIMKKWCDELKERSLS
jgi:hypothetical protein